MQAPACPVWGTQGNGAQKKRERSKEEENGNQPLRMNKPLERVFSFSFLPTASTARKTRSENASLPAGRGTAKGPGDP